MLSGIDLLYSLVISLSLTLIIEVSLCIPLFILKKIQWKELGNLLIVNILTNPIVVYISITTMVLFNLPLFNIVTIILEILVVIVEGLLLKKLLIGWGNKAFLLALYMNVISFGMSFIV